MSCHNNTNSTCNTCNQPICCCPAPAPCPPPDRVCQSPFDYLLNEVINCYVDQPCQNTYCTSPLVYAINTAVAQAAGTDITSIITSWDTLMTSGLVMSNTGNKPLCCPGCCGDNVYYLGNFVKYTLVQDNLNYAPNCCLNSRTNATISTALNNFFKNKSWPIPVKCDNKFEACVDLLFTKVDNQVALLTQGIVELPTVNFGTEVCNLSNTLTNIVPSLTATDIGTFVDNFLTKGFVYGCYNGKIFIGAADAFIIWNNNNQ